MAGNIKGITIEFRGDTTQLDKALNKIKYEGKEINKSLSQVNKALKLDPKNTELLAQKQKLLAEKIQQTTKNLEQLKSMQRQLDAQGIDKTSHEYMELRRNIIAAEQSLASLNAEQKILNAQNSKMGVASRKAEEFGNKLTSAGNAMKGLSAAAAVVATVVVGAMTKLATSSAKMADELNTMSKRYGIATDQLQLYTLAADLVDVPVETITKSHVKLTKSMNSAMKGTGDAANAFRELGISVVDSNGQLRDSNDVFTDTIKALGQIENETQRDAYALTLFGRSAADLNPLIEDMGETYEMVLKLFEENDMQLIDQETLDKANAFNDELDKIKATGLLAFQTLGAEIAGYLLPILEKVSGAIAKVASWLSKLDPAILTIIAVIAGLIAMIAPALILAGKIAFAISSITALLATMGTTIGAVTLSLLPWIAAIAAAIALGVLLYKNWEKIKQAAIDLWNNLKVAFESIKATFTEFFTNIKAKLTEFWEHVKYVFSFQGLVEMATSVFARIKAAITAPIEAAKNIIKAIIEKIKSFFNFEFKLPKLKVPKFSIVPEGWKIGDLLKGKIPKLSVTWHREGGIFTSPTLLQGANGSLHGVGEAGAEAILPLSKLQTMINESNASGNAMLAQIVILLSELVQQGESPMRVNWNERELMRLISQNS